MKKTTLNEAKPLSLSAIHLRNPFNLFLACTFSILVAMLLPGFVNAQVLNVNTSASYGTIQAAIDAAASGHTIQVDAGTYAENVTVNKSLTLRGANFNTACGSRGAESLIAPASGAPVTITANGVTLNGFEITSPNNGWAIEYSNRSNISILYNNIHDVGNDPAFGSIGPPANQTTVHAIRYQLNSGSYSNINISYNCLSNINHQGNVYNSASAIAFLQSPSLGTISDVTVSHNSISNVVASQLDFAAGGRIAYGIIINVGGNASFATNGKVENASITRNSISNLEGFISTAIALEGNTENAVIQFNKITELKGYKTANRAGGGLDLQAVKIENNRYAGTVSITSNSFDVPSYLHANGDGLGYGVANYVNAALYGEVTATCNWYGTNDVNLIEDNDDLNGKIFNKVGAETEFLPYLSVGTNNAPMGSAGFIPVSGACNLAPYADFVFEPPVITAGCDVFLVKLRIITNRPLTNAEARLVFDPSKIEIISITGPGNLPFPQGPLTAGVLPPTFNNTLGTMSLASQAAGAPFPDADFDYAEITFKTKAAFTSGTTLISHNTTVFPVSQIGYPDNTQDPFVSLSVLRNADPLTIEASSPVISGTVTAPLYSQLMVSGNNYAHTICSGDEVTSTPPSLVNANLAGNCGNLRVKTQFISTLPNIPNINNVVDELYSLLSMAPNTVISPTNITGTDQTITFTSFAYYDSNNNNVPDAGDVIGETIEFVLTVQSQLIITCPSTISAFNDAGQCSASVPFAATTVGTPSATIAYTIDDPGNPGNPLTIISPYTFPVGTTTVTATATNSCAVESCSFDVIVTDNEEPDAICQDITVQLNATGTVTVTPAQINDLSTDNCGIASYLLNGSASVTYTCANVGSNTVTLTVTDIHGNSNTCTATVTVQDNVAPSASCQDITIQLDGTGNATITGAQVDLGSTDACGIFTLSVSPDAFDCSNLGPNTVTLTVTDNNGNSSTCTATVTVQDMVAPTITCPANVTGLEVSIAPDPFVTGNPVGADNCSFGIVWTDNRSGLTLCNMTGTVVRTFTITDSSGNIASCSQNIEVVDTVDPVLTPCPAPIVASTDPDECDAAVSFGAPTALDLKYAESFEDANFVTAPNIGVPFQGWTNYNSPMFRVATGFDGITSATGAAHALIDAQNTPISTFTGVFSRLGGYSSNFGTGFKGQVRVYIDLADAAGLANSYGWDVSLAASNQSGGHLRDFIFHAANDAGGNVLIGGSNNSSFAVKSNIASGNHLVISTSGWYTLEWDFRNNGSDVLAVDLNLRDASGTLLWTETRSTPADVISTIVGGNRYMWFTFVETDQLAIDDVKLSRKAAVTCTAQSGDVFPLGATTVTCSTADACGNDIACSFTVTVNDNQNPNAICQDITVALDANGQASIVAADINNGSNDNCGPVTLSICPILVEGFEDQFAPANWSFDANGGTGSSSFTGTTSATIIGSNTGGGPGPLKDTELCISVPADGSISFAWNYTTVDIGGTLGISAYDPFGYKINGVFTKLTSDPLANQSGTATVNVQAGDVFCFVQRSTDDQLGAATTISSLFVYDAPTSACGFTCSDIGTNNVVLLVTDAAGNSSTCTAVVTVENNLPATISCPANQTFNLDLGECFATVTGTDATVVSNCDETYSYTITGATTGSGTGSVDGVQFEPGLSTVTYTATQGGATCNFTVFVAPTPSTSTESYAATLSLPILVGSGIPNTNMAISENCDIEIGLKAYRRFLGDIVPVGGPQNRYQVGTGLSPTSPAITATAPGLARWNYLFSVDLGNYTFNDLSVLLEVDFDPTVGPGVGPYVIDVSAFMISQSMGGSSVAQDAQNLGFAFWQSAPFGGPNILPFDPYAPGEYTFKLTVASGADILASSEIFVEVDCAFVIPSEDIDPPVLTCPGNQTADAISGQCYATFTGTTPGILTDNCITNLSYDITGATVASGSGSVDGVQFAVGVSTVTYSANDGNGNNAVPCSFTVTVTDTQAPLITCASDQDVDLTGTCQLVVPDLVSLNSATDNCGAPTITQIPLAGTILNSSHGQTHIVTLTATDAADNTDDCEVTLTGKDVSAPVITTCPSDLDVNLDADCELLVPDLTGSASATDNCTATLSQIPAEGTLLASGHNQTHVITIIATDAAGNTDECSVTLTGKDVTDPVIITCPADQDVNLNAGCELLVPDLTGATTANDNCTVTITQSPGAGTPLASGHNQTHVVTITATDAAGNAATCTVTLTGKDITPPSVICAAAGSRFVDQLNNTYQVQGSEFDPTSVSDNCTASGSIILQHNASTLSGVVATMGANSISLAGWQFPEGTTTVTFTATDGAGLSSTCPVVITVTPQTLTGNVSIINACTPREVRVRVYPAGGTSGTLLQTYFTTVNSPGVMSLPLTGLAPGTYDFYIKVEGYLQRKVASVVVTGSGPIISVTGLKAGDIAGGGIPPNNNSGLNGSFNDNFINTVDLSLMLAHYNTLSSNPLYNQRCDLDCDAKVDALDLSFISFFYFNTGDQPAP